MRILGYLQRVGRALMVPVATLLAAAILMGVEEGAEVVAGQPVLEMDLDFLNANARSMISPVVCSNIDDYSGLVLQTQGSVVAGQTPLYEIKGK